MRPTSGHACALMAGAAALLMGLTACGANTQGSSTHPAGEVKIDGSSTVGPLSKAAADLYSDEQPRVNAVVGVSGTGGGFKKFCSGETDISDASRPIKDSERRACEEKGVAFTELTVANDALTVVVNRENTWARCLTVAQLKRVWEPGSSAKTWRDIDPSFPAEPLKLFGAGTDSGTFDYFTAAINGEEKASRTDYTPSEDDNLIVQGVAGTKGGLGYFGYTYFEENASTLRAVQIDGGEGCVAPSTDTAQNGTYSPLSRPLFIYVSDVAAKKDHVRDFVDYYIEHIDTIVKEAKFVPLTAEQKSTLAREFESFKKG
jgi:phosphate transport system substrate-binding protein